MKFVFKWVSDLWRAWPKFCADLAREKRRRAMRGLLWGAGLFLAGCAGLPGATGPGVSPAAASKQLRVGLDRIVISGVGRFCIDPSFTSDNSEGAFVLLTSCAALSKSRKRSASSFPLILTATIAARKNAQPVAQSTKRLKKFFKTPAARAALSKTGTAKEVETLDTHAKDGVFYVHTRGASRTTPAQTGDTWRAMFDVKGHLVSVALTGSMQPPMPSDSAFLVLEQVARKMIAENGIQPIAAPIAVPVSVRVAAPTGALASSIRPVPRRDRQSAARLAASGAVRVSIRPHPNPDR